MILQPYTTYNNMTCVVGSAVIGTVIPKWQWDNMVKNPKIGAERKGFGHAVSSLIAFDKIPAKVKAKIVTHHGEPKIGHPPSKLEERLKADPEAVTYFSRIDLGISDKRRPQYIANAMVLNALVEAQDSERNARAAHGAGTGDFWARASHAVNELPKATGHNLPKNERSLKRKVDQYRTEGYQCLVHAGYGLENARKVTYTIEQLIVSIAVMPERPFTSTVCEYLALFLAGKREVFDSKTGELYDSKQFKNPNGSPLTVSESTVWDYCHKNRILIDSFVMGDKRFNDTHVPHHHRHAPNYAFSKITMDDRDLPRKLENGKRVKAYYTYDVASGVVIGRSYNRDKNADLFIECLKDTFRFVEKVAPGKIPSQVEVEHHLVSEFRSQLDEVFPLVRWCVPGNSQEKRAEHFNRTKKVTVERKNRREIGRWWARHHSYQVDEKRNSDDTYSTKTYPYDQLVAEDMADVAEYNANLHPNQKKYPGMSRMDVLIAHMSPNLANVDRPLLIRMIGEARKTSIKRSDYMTIQYEKYILPNSFGDMYRLAPNKKVVDAYWLADENGYIPEIHVFQNGRFIGTCLNVNRYNEANAEWTDIDLENYTEQSEHVKDWREELKDMKKEVAKIGIQKPDRIDLTIEPKVVAPLPQQEQNWDDIDTDIIDFKQRAIDQL